ncbi:MAG: multiple sugar transport system substrate-binding protein [Actinomycetota bacterium]|nr:multiple sugar transport system substrate-binding protein [Actinomycetota bacterium]
MVLALVLGLVAAGCGASGSHMPTTLHVLMTDDWVTAPFLDAVRDFEHVHHDVRVVVDKGAIRLQADTVRAGISAGTPADVVQGHAFSAASQGLAQPLDDLWASHLDASEFFPGAIEDVTWNGHRYGVPLDTNAMVLMYNVDHFRQAGLPDPQPSMSMDDFARIAQALSVPDGSRRGLAIPTSGWWTYGWIRANGGEVVQVGSDGKAAVTLDATPVVGALSFLAGLINAKEAFPPRGSDSHSEDAFALFASGVASMHTSGSWDIASLKKNSIHINYATTLMPAALGGGTAMGGSSTWVPVGSKHRELAFDFMTHLASDRYALRFAQEEGRLPVRLRVFGDPYFDDRDLRVFLEQLKTAHPQLLSAFPDAAADYDVAIDSILRVNGKDAATALHEAQLQAEAGLATAPAPVALPAPP